VYSSFDELSLAFDMPTDRAGLAPVQPTALADPAATGAGLRSGDRRWVDQYFEFSCSLGLDYSGEWESDAERVRPPNLNPVPNPNRPSGCATLTPTLTLTPTVPLAPTLTQRPTLPQPRPEHRP